MPTLAELKAENAAETAQETKELPQDDYTPEDEIKDEPEQKLDAPEDSEVEGEEAETDPDWLKPETADDSGDVPKFTDGDAAAIRRKYKGKLTEKDEKILELETKYAELEKKITAPAATPSPQNIGPEPQRDAYANDAEWIRALTTYNAQTIQAQTNAQLQADERRRKQEDIANRTKLQTDQHYARVAELAKKSNISEEVAQSADLKVRNAVNSVFKGAGDTIVDTLISSLGAGSEKVILHLGIKTSKLNELVRLFQEDPSGIKASAYLGTLKAELSAPSRRETKAPDPIDKVQGDKSGSGGQTERLRKQVADARKKGDISAVIRAKQDAKKLNINTSKW
jgi:hypothetical protein